MNLAEDFEREALCKEMTLLSLLELKYAACHIWVHVFLQHRKELSVSLYKLQLQRKHMLRLKTADLLLNWFHSEIVFVSCCFQGQEWTYTSTLKPIWTRSPWSAQTNGNLNMYNDCTTCSTRTGQTPYAVWRKLIGDSAPEHVLSGPLGEIVESAEKF